MVQSVEALKGKAAILSLDLQKAYDRVSIPYLKEVMKKMNFHPKFIDWILMLHSRAKTRLIMNGLSDLIDVDFSIRQGIQWQ